MRAIAAPTALLAAAVALTGCSLHGKKSSGGSKQHVSASYTVFFSDGGERRDVLTGRSQACLHMRGVSNIDQNFAVPPGGYVATFSGTIGQQKAVESCLAKLSPDVEFRRS